MISFIPWESKFPSEPYREVRKRVKKDSYHAQTNPGVSLDQELIILLQGVFG